MLYVLIEAKFIHPIICHVTKNPCKRHRITRDKIRYSLFVIFLIFFLFFVILSKRIRRLNGLFRQLGRRLYNKRKNPFWKRTLQRIFWIFASPIFFHSGIIKNNGWSIIILPQLFQPFFTVFNTILLQYFFRFCKNIQVCLKYRKSSNHTRNGIIFWRWPIF